MTSSKEQAAELRRLLDVWVAASDKADRIRSQYISSGSLIPGQPIRWPEKMMTPEAIREIDEAEKAEKEAYSAYMETRKRFWQAAKDA